MSSVPRHSEEELRQQWAFLDALVERQATSLKSGVQDPEEDDLPVAAVEADGHYKEEISVLTRRVTSLETERTTLLRRIDLSEQARMAAETARMAAEAARAAAERALEQERIGAGLAAPALAVTAGEAAPAVPAAEPTPAVPAAEQASAPHAAEPAPAVPAAEPAQAPHAAEPAPAVPAAEPTRDEKPQVAVVPASQSPQVAVVPAPQPPQVAQPPADATQPLPARPPVTSSRPRRRNWWQRFRE